MRTSFLALLAPLSLAWGAQRPAAAALRVILTIAGREPRLIQVKCTLQACRMVVLPL